jgi:hypothetical protein
MSLMMMKTNPITPPPELVEQWLSEHYGAVSVAPGEATSHVATEAARWGADQELEAILEMVGVGQQSLPEEDRYLDGFTVASIRAARRPKPQSLKQQALDELVAAERLYPADWSTIRRALEALDD